MRERVNPAMSWQEAAGTIRRDIQLFIDATASKETELFENIDPTMETVLCQAGVGSAADVDEAPRGAPSRHPSLLVTTCISATFEHRYGISTRRMPRDLVVFPLRDVP